jgi:preprotein translocase SecF subunit
MRHYDFLGKAKYCVPISIIVVVASAILLIPQVRGLKPGLDFTPGTEFTVRFTQPVETVAVRNTLAGISAGTTSLVESVIQSAGGGRTSVITTQLDVEANKEVIDRIETTLRQKLPVEDISRRSVGQKVTGEVVQRAWQAILLAVAAILIYITWRFRGRFAVGAVVAVIHDVTITLGVVALFRLEFNMETIAGLLTVLGYSTNDTIIIFDRVRENLRLDKKAPIYDIINLSINQSLTRTLTTAGVALAPIILLLTFGGPVLRGLAVALLMSVTVGTWSTFYIANPILYWWSRKAEGAKKGR